MFFLFDWAVLDWFILFAIQHSQPEIELAFAHFGSDEINYQEQSES